MENQVIRQMSTKELKERLEQERLTLTKYKLNHAINPLDNPHVIKQTKRTIARILTELRRRELEGNDNGNQ